MIFTDICKTISALWMMENEIEIERHGHRAVKYVIRQLWPQLAAALDKCSWEIVKYEELVK